MCALSRYNFHAIKPIKGDITAGLSVISCYQPFGKTAWWYNVSPLKYVGLILKTVCGWVGGWVGVCVCACVRTHGSVCHPTHLYTRKAMKPKAAANRTLAVTTTLVALGDLGEPEGHRDQVD